MSGASTTGRGPGASGQPTTKTLAILANAPSILISGVLPTEEDEATSPPTPLGSVTFPEPLPGGAENYVVLLTTHNGGYAYVTDTDEVDGDFSGFSFNTQYECDCMYLVTKIGVRPDMTS